MNNNFIRLIDIQKQMKQNIASIDDRRRLLQNCIPIAYVFRVRRKREVFTSITTHIN